MRRREFAAGDDPVFLPLPDRVSGCALVAGSLAYGRAGLRPRASSPLVVAL
jgi:hypothetical protein